MDRSRTVSRKIVVPVVFVILLWKLSLAGVRELGPEPGAGANSPGLRVTLRQGWLLKSSSQVPQDGDVVSTPEFLPEKETWYPTSVPSTVLNALIQNRVYPDMRVGMNNFLIPDASDEFNEANDLSKYSYLPDKRNPWKDPYWFRTEFSLPRFESGQTAWLHFDCINYRADVWLNGSRIADRETMVGSFQRYVFDITKHTRKERNCLAAKIYPVDHPGTPDRQGIVYGPERRYQKEILRDVTMVMSVGYDCMPTVRDRNMGILQDVYVDLTGPVDIRNPFVVTDLPLPETRPASLKVSAELVNSTQAPQRGTLRARLPGTSVTCEREVALAPGETRQVSFTPEQVIEDPLLWWPVNHGPQNIYRLLLDFVVGGKAGLVSDAVEVPFGVREITKELHEYDGGHGLRVHVNGKKIFCRGGYIQPEILLSSDAARMETEIRYFTSANLNLVYYEDIPNPPEAFLEACDRYGLMFGNCFYGCYWMRPGTDFPLDLTLLERSTVDIIKRYRNHPSLILYMAMNEGDTREDVYTMWRKHIRDHDGTRLHIPSGTFPSSREDVPPWIAVDTPVGMTDVGASYTWQDPVSYYRRVRDDRRWMFMIESGSASLPPFESLRRFIPDMRKAPEGDHFPLDETWAEHGANHYFEDYDRALRRIHGEPSSAVDYAWKGHLVTADQHRAMFEAVNHRMWDITSGFTQWKINACWPSVQWQIFDWYLRPMVSYYYIKKACEQLHVQLNLVDSTVAVINNRLEPACDLEVSARVIDLGMGTRFSKKAETDVGASAYREVLAIDVESIAGLTPIYFVKLELKDRKGKLLSDNFYWLSRATPADFRPLGQLPLVRLDASSEFEAKGPDGILRLRLSNPTDRLAFFVQPVVTRGLMRDEVLPVFWEDSYFSLLPHETKEVAARFALSDLRGARPAVEVGGWNVQTDYFCGGLEPDGKEVDAGEEFSVEARISNTFLHGGRIELLVDGRSVGSKWAWARDGIEEKVSFDVRLLAAGKHELKVGRRTASVVVK